jgi:hypothetical protein
MNAPARTICVALLTAAGMTGCETPADRQDQSATNTAMQPLIFPKPAETGDGPGEGKWTAIPRNGGQEYVKVLDGMEDVVSFYGFWSETSPEVRTFDDMERVMRSDQSFGFRSLERGEIMGVPVLWFEKSATERGSGSARLAQALRAVPRRPDGTYHVVTRGVFMIQPGSTPRFVTLACARTSTAGQIGAAWTARFNEWLTGIVGTSFL